MYVNSTVLSDTPLGHYGLLNTFKKYIDLARAKSEAPINKFIN